MIGLERAFRLDADIFGLVGPQLCQLDADLGEMQPCHLFIQGFRQHIDLLLVLAATVVGEQFDLRQRLLVKEADITNEGCPMALPRFTRRPSDNRIMRLPFGKVISSTCGLMLVHFRLRKCAIWISLSKWPMLQTMARSFIARMCSMVMMSLLPVAVTKMSARGAASSMVTTS